jgi:hypothetical protein
MKDVEWMQACQNAAMIILLAEHGFPTQVRHMGETLCFCFVLLLWKPIQQQSNRGLDSYEPLPSLQPHPHLHSQVVHRPHTLLLSWTPPPWRQ